jgi:asparagine synthase (glutamine-hydrolysing)
MVAGSSLRALAGYPGFRATLDREAVAAYLGCGWVPSPRCLIAGLRALPPGWQVDVTLGPDGVPVPDARPWFTLNAWLPEKPGILEDAAVADGADHLERTLLTALEAGLRGSAAPGVVLSPAPQSMLLAGLYGASSARALRSLSFSFGDPRLDAQDPTVEIASALGLNHRVEPLSAQALIDLVVDLPVLFDEPIADPAALATLYAATILRQGCDTILTGVGADLLLGIRPIHAEALRGRAGSPRSARRWLGLAPFGWLNTVSSQGRSLSAAVYPALNSVAKSFGRRGDGSAVTASNTDSSVRGCSTWRRS